MKRRRFLQAAGAFAGASVICGGVWGGVAYGRSRLSRQLIDEATPILVEKEHSEVNSIPDAASEEMKLWFTGACLNSAQFINHICSEGFVSRLKQFPTSREREICIKREFFTRVISPNDVLQRIEMVAAKSGAVLDRGWQTCCKKISKRWNLKLNSNSLELARDVQSELDPLISSQIDQAISQSENIANRPTMISAAVGIGKTSLMLLPVLRLPYPSNLLSIPAFALIAIAHFAEYAVGRLFQDPSSAQVAFSDRMALLGNRVASNLKAALKIRIADLHTWQNEALRKTAEEYAYSKFSII